MPRNKALNPMIMPTFFLNKSDNIPEGTLTKAPAILCEVAKAPI